MANTTFTGPLIVGRKTTTTSEGKNGEIIIQNADGSTSSVGAVSWTTITANAAATAATGLFVNNAAQSADITITMPAGTLGDTIRIKNVTAANSAFTYNEYVYYTGAGGIEGIVSGAGGVGGAAFNKGTLLSRGFGTGTGEYVFSGTTSGWVRV